MGGIILRSVLLELWGQGGRSLFVRHSRFIFMRKKNRDSRQEKQARERERGREREKGEISYIDDVNGRDGRDSKDQRQEIRFSWLLRTGKRTQRRSRQQRKKNKKKHGGSRA
ncbi:hypothetical protein HL42_1515 [Trichophyton rubrum]|nr:hypothetical protein HL42_1515 [Trichophyton rubrum]